MLTGQNFAVAKVFMTGRSQAVRLPKEYRFNSDQVLIKPYIGGGILLQYPPQKKKMTMDEFLAKSEPVSDFVLERPANNTKWAGRNIFADYKDQV
ncbi:MAG: hypothetical protein LBJ18_01710 [Rickettsiales bacterium]|jgi:antitoxin VapB|nr:hypothetical protein [Rickettsiales bacterium]